MVIDLNKFLISITSAIATAAGLNFINASAPRSLWLHQAVEGFTTDPYIVLDNYGGPEPDGVSDRFPCISIQLAARGTDKQSTLMSLSQILENVICTNQRLPRSNWVIAAKQQDTNGQIVNEGNAPSWRVFFFTGISQPAIVGVDEQSRHMATMNFNVRFDREPS